MAARGEKLTTFAKNLVSTAVRSTSILPSPLSIEEIQGHSEPSHTSATEENTVQTVARLSRAAAQAVRLSIQQPGSQEAYLIVKSLQESVKQYRPGVLPNLYALQGVAIDFKQAVSPRLSMHCLLHGLLRRGLSVKAGRFAHEMIRAGVEVNMRTMQALTSALCHTDMAALRDEGFRSQLRDARHRAYKAGEVGHRKPPRISSGSVQCQSTRLAVQLFFAAKQYQKQRARQMFQQLIDACLLQGEIIVVSFLFAFLVKQWQLRRAQACESSDDRSEKSPGIDTWPLSKNDMKTNGRNVFLPGPGVLQRTLEYIDAAVFNTIPPEPQASLPSFEEAAQALAFIAGLMNNYLLPYSQLSKLISLLTAFPREPAVQVWTRKGNIWKLKNAREYFDEILEDLVNSVTAPEIQNHEQESRQIIDRYSYNSLLHYALRYKTSPSLGSKIFNHMVAAGGTNSPDITTFNIILRSSTLLRKHELTSKTLQLLRERHENKGYEDILTAPACPSGWKDELPDWDPFRSVGNDDFPAFNSSFSSNAILKPDGHTLTAFLSHLTSIGRPDVVVSLLFQILPELHIVNHPATTEEARQQRRDMIELNRRKCLEHAVALGPHFFVTVLNALSKAGKTGLTERVWILAKTAEKLSWNPDFARGTVRPWCLPISAYTIMMQCYAAESHKGFHSLSMRPRHLDDEWRPPHKGGVKGWAWFILVTQEMSRAKEKNATSPGTLSSIERRLAARQLGIQLLRAMRSGGRAVYEQLVAVMEDQAGQVNIKGIKPPVPDARFFNAALELFGRSPKQISRENCVSPVEWRRLHRRAHVRFMLLGRTEVANADPRLEEVLRTIYDAGYEVPLPYRKMFVGRRVPPPKELPCNVRAAPLAYKHMPRARAPVHRIPTIKTRGFPLRRKKGRRIASNISDLSESKPHTQTHLIQ